MKLPNFILFSINLKNTLSQKLRNFICENLETHLFLLDNSDRISKQLKKNEPGMKE